MSLALYRKYRSRSFDTVVGQDHITETLKNSVDSGTFSHAYLLTGLRGVGKTSVARIFAAYVNGINYEEAENNPDIIEIDAASNRKIDEIRDLREKVNIAPSGLKYKVYIIDEVHMLTREAFNALLKTLEEPPKHCILILATTDYHKLPETIISRCIRFSFRSITDKDIVGHLENIAAKEKINIDKEALQAIAENSSGSLRDAITILDQARNISQKVSESEIELLLGLASKTHISKLYRSVQTKDAQKTIAGIEEIQSSGANPDQSISQFTRLIRSDIMADRLNLPEYARLLSDLMDISDYSDKWLAFEICLLKHIAQFSEKTENTLSEKKVTTEVAEETTQTDQEAGKAPTVMDSDSGIDLWQNVLNELKKTNSTLYGVARMAEAIIDGEVLELRLKFNFHKKQLDIKNNQVKIIEIAGKHNPSIKRIVTMSIKETDLPAKPQYDNTKDISNISNVFGSAEMLE